ncbi:MobA/MobL family protein [Sphingomonas sp. TX0543]|uniref:MobA/MobL family protein n=1 Tax=unclassified Sphingomonas TaxID=196159 RepID=UPI001484EF3D|nr:MobA/MobL family protein [Sphingomonas sp. 3P27F8]
MLRQARSEATKQRRLAAKEKADELQRNLEDRAAARRFLQELAEIDRESRRMAATLRAKVKADRPAPQTSDVVKRVTMPPSRKPISMTTIPSSWVIDDFGMRGVHYSQSYIGRKSPGFYRGAARDRWLYEARDEAVLRDAEGEPIIIANLGDDLDEISAAWQAIEDATTRKNGKIQIRLIVALDADASDAEKAAALNHFCKTVLEPLGLPYSAVIHRAPDGGDSRNVHAHILTNFRPTTRIEPYCWSFADHVRGELDGRDGVQMLRHLWAHSMSEAAEKAQRNMRYTGLGYGARGLNLEAGEHLNEARSAMARRGKTVWAYERNRIKNARNALRRSIHDADKKIAALTQLRDAAIAEMRAREAEARAPRKLVHANAPRVHMPLIAAPASNSTQSPRLTASQPESFANRLSAATVAPTAPPPMIQDAQHVGKRPLRTAAGRSATPSIPLIVPKDLRQPSSMAAAGREIEMTRVSAAPSGQPVTVRPPLTAGAGGTPRTTTLITARTLVATDRKVSSQHSHDRRLSVADKGAPPFPLLSLPGAAPAQQSSSQGTSPAKVLEPSITAEAHITPLASRMGVDGDDETVMRTRNLLAALNTWREADRGVSLVAPGAAGPKKTRDSEDRRGDAAHGLGTPNPAAVPPAVRTYRGRRTFAKSADRGPQNTLDVIPDREWLEDHPRTEFDDRAVRALERDEHLIDRLRRADIYVGDFRDGSFGIDPRMTGALDVDDDWLMQRHVQRALSDFRSEQQQVVAALSAEAQLRPLAFSKTGVRFWPNDLDLQLKQRVDRWARDEFFGSDVFAIELAVRQAHRDNDVAEQRSKARALAKADVATMAPEDRPKVPRRRSDDGGLDGVRIVAFSKKTGKPTRPLLMLIRYAGEYPNRIDVARRSGLEATDDVPETIRTLLKGWQHDPRVRQLVVATVSLSRAASRPVWPLELSAEMRAIVTNVTAPSWSPQELHLSR